MDYSKVVENLKTASLFDLYRLSVAINQALDDPTRNAEIRARLKPGQIVSYFDYTEKRLIKAKVIKLYKTQLLVENLHDQHEWRFPLYWINLDEVDTEIVDPARPRLDKDKFKLGDQVSFRDDQNNDLYGKIIRLNQKTATVKTTLNTEWRVGYGWLHLVMDGE